MEDQKKGTTYVPLLSVLAAIFFLGKLMAPIFFIFTLLCPIPIVAIGLRFGSKAMVMGATGSAILVILLTGSPVFTVVFVMMFALPAFAMCEVIKREYTASVGIVAGFFAMMVGFWALSGVAGALTGHSGGLEDFFSQFLSSSRIALENWGHPQKMIEMAIEATRILIPSMIMLAMFGFSVGTYYATQVILPRVGLSVVRMKPVSAFKVGLTFIFMLLTGMALIRGFDPGSPLEVTFPVLLGVNFMTISQAGFFLDGFGLVKFFVDRMAERTTQAGGFPGFMGALVLIFFVYKFHFCILLGIADSIIDFRRSKLFSWRISI